MTWRWPALFMGVLLIGGWPSAQLRGAASAALAPALSACLAPLEFGYGGRAQVLPSIVSEVRRAGENVSSDALLRLTIDGYANDSISTINLRRDVYLPLLLVLALLLSAPSSRRRRAWALALALPGVFSLCVLSLYLTACWLFAHQVPDIYPLSAPQLRLLDALVSTLLMPPSLRFFVPLAVGWVALSLAGLVEAPARRSLPAAPPATR
jgi:hypothetical protein